MTKVRVSEETPNLSHPSNLISTVRLENPSPSLMRSTRERGCTHSWVVQAFLLREQERARERLRWRKETTFAEGEHASQGKEKYGFQGSRQQGRTGCTVRICGGHIAFNVHRNRGGQQLQFLRVLTCIPRLSYNIYWHRNRGNCCNEFLSVFLYSPYSLERILRVVQHGLQGVVHAGFSVQS